MDDFGTVLPGPLEHEHPGLRVKMEGFEESEELEAVAEALIARHGRLRFLDDYGIAYLLHHADPPKSRDRHKWATARLVPKWARPLTGRVEAVITVNAPVWGVITEQQREALMLHELLHLGRTDDGDLETVPHDVEEFGFVVATYGQWRASLVDFAEQLGMGLQAGPSPSSPPPAEEKQT